MGKRVLLSEKRAKEFGEQALIPGLPDDVAESCLARARDYSPCQKQMKRVCRRWRDHVLDADVVTSKLSPLCPKSSEDPSPNDE